MEHALVLNPTPLPWYFAPLGIARYFAGSYDAAAEALKQAPPGGEPLMFLILAEAMRGQVDEARKLAVRLKTESPSLSIEGYIRDSPVIPATSIAAIREGATRAGLLPVSTQ